MNKELLYDIAKLLKRHKSEDIAEVSAFLGDPSNLQDVLALFASLEVLSKEMRTKKAPKRDTVKPVILDSGFKGISDAILRKKDANKSEQATPRKPSE